MFFVLQRFSTFLHIIFILKIVSIEGQFQGQDCIVQKTQQPGICKSVTNCPSILNNDDDARCGFENKVLFICCPSSESNTTTPVPTISENARISEKKCIEYGSTVYTYTNTSLLPGDTGYEEIRIDKCEQNVVPLIVDDIFASPRGFPHVALLGYENKENQTEWLCEGTLISDQYILTAAHCIFSINGKLKYVRLGDLNNQKNDDDADPEDFNIAQIISHPNYKPPLAYDDIGLIKLNRKVKFNPYKRPACLPVSFEEKENLLSVIVWDQLQFGEDTSGRLQKIILEKIPTEICNETFGELSHRKLLSKGIISKQICAGPRYQSKDTCQRGSSGPIQVLHSSIYCMYTVVGVTSFGIPCGAVGVPGVYTRIFSYLDWIENIVWN